jgi:hypothetical protein
MQAKRSDKLTARDFTYVYEPGIGQSYQNGPYLIGVGRDTYSCNYQGRCFQWGLTDFLSAIEACAKHDAARRTQAHLYTRRCQMIEEHGRLTSEQE